MLNPFKHDCYAKQDIQTIQRHLLTTFEGKKKYLKKNKSVRRVNALISPEMLTDFKQNMIVLVREKHSSVDVNTSDI